MKKLILIMGLGSLLLFGACTKDKDKSKGAAAEQTPQVAVAVPVIDSVTLHKVYPGFMQASNEVDVVARVNGTLESVNYTAGQYVQKGQVLFTIERTTHSDAVKRAQASLANAQSERQYCSTRLAAMQKAFKSNAVSQMDVIQAQNNLNQAEAAIATAKAELNDAQTQLGYCTVRAPQSGYITKSILDPGNYVGGGASPVKLATIYQTDYMTAKFSIETAQFERLVGKTGGTNAPLYRNVPLTFQVEMPHSYSADLTYTAPNVDESTGTIIINGKVKNPYNELKDGMFVSVELPYGTNPKAVLVKDASISTDQRGQYLYVIGKDNKVEYRPVTVGQVYQDTLRIIDSGINPREQYVTEALLTVRPGMTVKPVLTK
ncbi:MAG: efflux RND transporter periplasmic adaptor subunit [Muribaculaceae bacterium]|nr:efflux RND transporter periplasmic adaptor subunit [Muribaculaceae bacterium]